MLDSVIRKIFVRFVLLGLIAIPLTVAANDSQHQLKFELQASMQNYIEDRLVDGEYLYLDTTNGAVARARPSTAHPTILAVKDGYILCADFRTRAGENLNVDFFVTEVDSEYVVFSHTVEDRGKVKMLMKQGLAKKL